MHVRACRKWENWSNRANWQSKSAMQNKTIVKGKAAKDKALKVGVEVFRSVKTSVYFGMVIMIATSASTARAQWVCRSL